MMTTLQITIDKKTKNKAQSLAKEMGLDISNIVKDGLNNFVQYQTFYLKMPIFVMPDNSAIIEKPQENKKSGKNLEASAGINALDSKLLKGIQEARNQRKTGDFKTFSSIAAATDFVKNMK